MRSRLECFGWMGAYLVRFYSTLYWDKMNNLNTKYNMAYRENWLIVQEIISFSLLNLLLFIIFPHVTENNLILGQEYLKFINLYPLLKLSKLTKFIFTNFN